MDLLNSLGVLIPLWILGAPLVAGLFAMTTASTPTRRDATDSRLPYPRTMAVSYGNR